MSMLRLKKKMLVNEQLITVKRRIGGGTTTKVFEGFDECLNRPVAIKECSFKATSLNDSYALYNQYLSEVRSYCMMQASRRVARLFNYELDLERSRGRIVMELGDRGQICKLMQRSHCLREKLNVWYSMARAVAAVHRRSIVHADVKPENFILGIDGTIKLIDFGYSLVVDRQPVYDYFRGTYCYVSPEVLALVFDVQMTAGRASEQSKFKPIGSFSEKCDVWALGCILYEIVYGRPYLTFKYSQLIRDPVEYVLEHMINRRFPSLADSDLFDLLYKCMTLSPCLRISTREIMRHRFVERLRSGGDVDVI